MPDNTDTLASDNDTDDTLVQLDTVNETLLRTEDYAHRIHFWVRLWSILSLVSIALAVGITLIVVGGNALSADVVKQTPWEAKAEYDACISAWEANPFEQPIQECSKLQGAP